MAWMWRLIMEKKPNFFIRMFFRNNNPVAEKVTAPNGLSYMVTQTGFYMTEESKKYLSKKAIEMAIKEEKLAKNKLS